MTPRIKQYLDQTKTKNNFLFFKLYLHPEKSLGSSDEKTLDDYQEYGDIKKLIINKNFYPFLKECMEDKEFESKLDYVLLRKIRYILFDIYSIKKEYIDDLEDEYLRDWCKNKVSLGSGYSKKYNLLSLWEISEHYQKYGWMYEMGINKEFLDQLDEKLLKKMIDDNTWKIKIYEEIYINPIEERNRILKRIKEDDYSKLHSCFLQDPSIRYKKDFNHLICDNEFLKILEEILLEKELSDNIIDNIISILEIGLEVKTLRVDRWENLIARYSQLGKKKVNEFNYSKAQELIRFFKKRDQTKK